MKNADRKINKSKLTKVYIIACAAILCVLILAFIVLSSKVKEQKKINAQLSRQIVKQSEENSEAMSILESDSLKEYIEQKAKEDGYVNADERVFHDGSAD